MIMALYHCSDELSVHARMFGFSDEKQHFYHSEALDIYVNIYSLLLYCVSHSIVHTYEHTALEFVCF